MSKEVRTALLAKYDALCSAPSHLTPAITWLGVAAQLECLAAVVEYGSRGIRDRARDCILRSNRGDQ